MKVRFTLFLGSIQEFNIPTAIILIQSMQKISQILASFAAYIYDVTKFQVTRIIKRGYGIAISLVTFAFYFTFYPDIIAYFWPTMLTLTDQIWLFIFTLAGLNIFLTFTYSICMYVIYTRKFAFLEQYRISKELWPWQTNYQEWKDLLIRSVKSISLNAFIVGPTLVYLDCQLSFKVKMQMEDLPESKLTYFWQFVFFLIVEEIWNYLMHALLHQPSFYWIHKPHHEYKITVSVAGQHIHPIEYILSSSLSTGLGYKILINFYPVHIFSLIIWMTFRVIETNDSHAGYNWPWIQSALIPGNSGDNYHYYHHKINVGNYAGIMYFMDSLFGSNRSFWKYGEELALQQQKYKQPKSE